MLSSAIYFTGYSNFTLEVVDKLIELGVKANSEAMDAACSTYQVDVIAKLIFAGVKITRYNNVESVLRDKGREIRGGVYKSLKKLFLEWSKELTGFFTEEGDVIFSTPIRITVEYCSPPSYTLKSFAEQFKLPASVEDPLNLIGSSSVEEAEGRGLG